MSNGSNWRRRTRRVVTRLSIVCLAVGFIAVAALLFQGSRAPDTAFGNVAAGIAVAAIGLGFLSGTVWFIVNAIDLVRRFGLARRVHRRSWNDERDEVG